MKSHKIIALILLILLSTITINEKLTISKFDLKEIKIENNLIIKEEDLKRSLKSIYNKNLIFLKNKEIEKLLIKNTLIDSFKIKKKFPNTLEIKIFEIKPIAILINKKEKFYISEKINLIKFDNLPDYQNLPQIFGNIDNFKIFFKDLKKVNFPFNQIKRLSLYEANRWDLETLDDKTIRLPTKNYINSLKNYLSIKNKDNFRKYRIFDYRVNETLILK